MGEKYIKIKNNKGKEVVLCFDAINPTFLSKYLYHPNAVGLVHFKYTSESPFKFLVDINDLIFKELDVPLDTLDVHTKVVKGISPNGNFIIDAINSKKDIILTKVINGEYPEDCLLIEV